LSFGCFEDINAVKQLYDLKSTLKNQVTRIITKGKQTLILIFSKEVLVAIFIFLESSYIERNVDWSSFSSSEVSQSCVSKSNISRFLTSPSQIQYSMLKFASISNVKPSTITDSLNCYSDDEYDCLMGHGNGIMIQRL
jgi:hypothetical protein